MLLFRRLTDKKQIARYLAGLLKANLTSGRKVLWFLSGGSSIELEAATSKELMGVNLENLTVTLCDERYGKLGHADSNWQLLQQAGLNLPRAKIQPVLSGESPKLTTSNYA